MLRGDKGVRTEKEVTAGTYFKLGLKLCKPHTLYIAVAFACLLLNAASSLWLPNYTGRIFDDIKNYDRPGFHRNVEIYALITLATALFSSLRSLMFRLVGARIAVHVRNDMFERIVKQDVAYFDGAKTGDLMSRLSGDVSNLVSPIRTMLGTVLSSTILLFGGIALCFYTSWRLSMLVFVTVAPVMYVTDQYARWSKRLLFEYLSALGDASATANEALQNVRTVKAFSTERWEWGRYKDSTALALKKMVKDAVGSAGAGTLTTCLDLGGAVLILWYGGTLVLSVVPGQAISLGTLVAFRMYWVMINSNYKSLMNVLNGFTRAAAAAQRIITLLDSSPDIDPHAGRDPGEITGALTLKDVEFS